MPCEQGHAIKRSIPAGHFKAVLGTNRKLQVDVIIACGDPQPPVGPGSTCGKSAVYESDKAIRPPEAESPEMCFEGVLGKFSQHDLGSVKATYAHDSTETVHFFASRLKYSRWTHVVTVPNESRSGERELLQSPTFP